MSDRQHTILVMRGPEGPSLYLDDYRVAGPKPWGGGTVLHEFTFTDKDLIAAGVTLAQPQPITSAPGGVHNHGTEDGPGIACREYRIGACRLAQPQPDAVLRTPTTWRTRAMTDIDTRDLDPIPVFEIGDTIVIDGAVYEINREPNAITPHLTYAADAGDDDTRCTCATHDDRLDLPHTESCALMVDGHVLSADCPCEPTVTHVASFDERLLDLESWRTSVEARFGITAQNLNSIMAHLDDAEETPLACCGSTSGSHADDCRYKPQETAVEAISTLENYGDHHGWCVVVRNSEEPEDRCDCGFFKQMARLRARRDRAEMTRTVVS